MKKLILIAAMLLLPAIAMAEYVIVDTDFEGATYGNIDGQTFDGGYWFNASYTDPQITIVDDPTGAGKGKIASFQSWAGGPDGFTRLTCERTDQPTPVTYWGGLSVMEFEIFLTVDFLDNEFTNRMENYWGPKVSDYYDPEGEVYPDEIDLWKTGPEWPSPDREFYEGSGGPLPVFEWFTVRFEYTNANNGSWATANVYDYYINDVLMASDMPAYWMEDNYMEWNLYRDNECMSDEFMEETGWGYAMISNVYWSYIPEPSVLLLGGFGLLALLRRRKK